METIGTASAFTVRELTGDGVTIRLMGRALPYRPLTFSSEQRLESTWYPGNPIATTQVFGRKENESTFTGYWKDKFVRNTTADGRLIEPDGRVEIVQGAYTIPSEFVDASRIVHEFDEMVGRGQLVEVSWDVIVRHGFLRKFTHKWQRHEDIEWEMTFEWVSRGEKLVPVAIPNDIDQSSLRAQLETKLSEFVSKATAPFAVVEAFQADLDAATELATDAVASVSDAAQNVSDAVLSPVEAAKKTTAAIQTVASSMSQAADAITARTAAALVTTGETVEDAVSFGAALRAELYGRRLSRAARDMRYTAVESGERLGAVVQESEIVATFVAREGEDLREVSTRYYGTPDEWRNIKSYNGLATSKLTAGDVIFVPKLRSAETAT